MQKHLAADLEFQMLGELVVLEELQQLLSQLPWWNQGVKQKHLWQLVCPCLPRAQKQFGGLCLQEEAPQVEKA